MTYAVIIPFISGDKLIPENVHPHVFRILYRIYYATQTTLPADFTLL